MSDKAASFSQRLREALDARGMKQVELAEKSQISKSSISRYLKGDWEGKQSAVYALAKALGVTEAWLMGYDVPMEESTSVLPTEAEPYKPMGYMPVLGRVAAGLPIYAEENIEEYIVCDFPNSEDYFALKVKGDSMNAAGINEDDYVIVRKQDIVDNGDIAVVLVNGDEATVKRFSRTDNTVVLTPQSMNPAHQVQIYDTKDVPVRVLGKVVESRHKY